MFKNIIIEPLGKHHDRTAFCSGEEELDRYLKQYANQNVKQSIATVFVAAVDDKVVGFYTLSTISFSYESLPEATKQKLPKYPIPGVLLGRLAVDRLYQGKRLGEKLMINAMVRVLQASTAIGIYALVVDAKNEKAKSYYMRFGFIEFKDSPMRLFLPKDTISALVNKD